MSKSSLTVTLLTSSGMFMSCCYLDRDLKECEGAAPCTKEHKTYHEMPLGRDLPRASPRCTHRTGHSSRCSSSLSRTRRGGSQALNSCLVFQSKIPLREWYKYLTEMGRWHRCRSTCCFLEGTSTASMGKKEMQVCRKNVHVSDVFKNVTSVVCTLI